MEMVTILVAVQTPQHAAIESLLHYESEQSLAPGTLVRVPLGRRDVLGIVWPEQSDTARSPPPSVALRPVSEALTSLAPLPLDWCKLVRFAAGYYQRSVGELALSALPPELRKLGNTALARRLQRLAAAATVSAGGAASPAPPPTPEQAEVLHALMPVLEAAPGSDAPRPVLLHGATGSGKTEVYLRLAEQALSRGRQVLMMVPEINLTPQLLQRVAERFPGRHLASQHSGMTPAQRLNAWLAVAGGRADIVLGTRLAIFSPLSRLGLLIVDEEHDASYKQQEGARYSARDLAVYRARLENVPVLLGSATPSFESWQRAIDGRYRLLKMAHRVGDTASDAAAVPGDQPTVRIVDLARLTAAAGGKADPPVLAPPLLDAIRQRIARGEQSLLLLNRRGYAPVLHCPDCGWKSECPNCSAWRVFHKADRTLRCHHCSFTEAVPRACPVCGNLDIHPIGRGTEKLHEQVAAALPQARVARIDADSTRRPGELSAQLAAVHAGEVDVLVGTQMVTKGHDFRRITLVAAVNPDGALFAGDFRAPERLFALLLQAAGRAGRDARAADASEMWVQTSHPRHPLFEALVRHDYESFAQAQLQQRKRAGLPPFSHLALLRAEARDADAAQRFLQAARDAALNLPLADGATFYAPVPAPMAKVAGFERRQMLVESVNRALLQRLLAEWTPLLPPLRSAHKGIARWAIDVDPQAI
jgi:primosomal protein N' (replication factor Y) (superfamily II helicase)